MIVKEFNELENYLQVTNLRPQIRVTQLNLTYTQPVVATANLELVGLFHFQGIRLVKIQHSGKRYIMMPSYIENGQPILGVRVANLSLEQSMNDALWTAYENAVLKTI